MTVVNRFRRLIRLETALEVSLNPEADGAFTQLENDIETALNTLENGDRSSADNFQNAVLPVLNSLATLLDLKEPDGSQTLSAFKEFGDMKDQIQQCYTELRDYYNGATRAKKATNEMIHTLTLLQEDIDILNKVYETYKAINQNN